MSSTRIPVKVRDHRAIPLRRYDGTIRAYAIVDIADADWLNRWRWHLTSNGYVARRDKGHTILMHRQILGLETDDTQQGEHENLDRLDCTRSNLRVCRGQKDNMQNTTLLVNNTSGYRGVYWNKRKQKWHARVMLNYKHVHLGYFDDLEKAAQVVSDFRATHMPFSQEAMAA